MKDPINMATRQAIYNAAEAIRHLAQAFDEHRSPEEIHMDLEWARKLLYEASYHVNDALTLKPIYWGPGPSL